MAIRAGFSAHDITPAIGTRKAGWLKYDTTNVSDTVRDPLYARTAVLQSEGGKIAFIALDVLSIRWTQVNNIRKRIQQESGFPGANILVAATHNHSGPATVNLGDTPRDEAYLRILEDGAARAFQDALGNMREAEIGFGYTFEWKVAYNRRVVLRDGTARMKGSFTDPNSLYIEGPIDPEVAVLAVRSLTGEKLGLILNFACHPIHHGGDTVISGGFPGELARQLSARGWPQTLFLNGTAGNLSHGDPSGARRAKSLEEAGLCLAKDAEKVVAGLKFRRQAEIRAGSATIELPFRTLTEDELQGTTWGAQRAVEYGDTSMYDRDIPRTAAKIRKRGVNLAEIQAFMIDDIAVVALPGEIFVESGLLIKKKAHPLHALLVSHANGMIGYVPPKEAFAHGGYETTFAGWSRLAPTAAELLVDGSLGLLADLGQPARRSVKDAK